MSEPVLCYVDGAFAFFTTQALAEQWGDDWNDAPYEHNAGPPYVYRLPFDADRGKQPWEIVQVAFECELEVPSFGVDQQHPEFGFGNSRWSVEDINAGKVPWLRSWYTGQPKIEIWAGCTLPAFVELIEAARGTVYFPARPSNP